LFLLAPEYLYSNARNQPPNFSSSVAGKISARLGVL